MSIQAVQQEAAHPTAVESRSSIPGNDPRWLLALRVSESPDFARAPLLAKFLLFISEWSLLGKADELTEHKIGVQVFRRRPDYKTSEDNIVRNYTRQLRQRLDRYFEGPGQNEDYRITIPRGYIPVFEPRIGHEPPVFEADAVANPPQPDSASPAAVRNSWLALPGRIPVLLLAGLVLFAADWAGVSLAHHRSASTSHASALWKQLFSNTPTTIVTEDGGLQVLQDITGHQSTLTQYIDGSYLGQFKEGTTQESIRLHRISGERLTNTPDDEAARLLTSIPEAKGKLVFVRNARVFSLNDLKQHNTILLGSNYADPWVSVFEPQMNFRLVYDLVKNESHIINVHPRPGEQSVYQDTGDIPPYATYAVIALLPNPTRSGWVLIIEGLRETGIQAGIEFLLDEDPDALLQKVRRADGTLRPFEALLQTTNLSSEAVSAKIVTYRVY